MQKKIEEAFPVRIYADDDEQEHMDVCHLPSIKLIEGVLNGLSSLDPFKALDVGCGDGIFTRDCLKKWFSCVDMFDQCPVAIDKVQRLKAEIDVIGRVVQSKFHEYNCNTYYSAIFLRWTPGYMADDELVAKLMSWKLWLKPSKRATNFRKGTGSYIVVLDNVVEESEQTTTKDGQRLRSKKRLETLFEKAKLQVFKCTRPHLLVRNYHEVVVWVLN